MKNIKKYLIGFIIGLSIVTSIGFAAAPNYGSIGAMFNIVDGEVLGMSGSSLMNNSVGKVKLNFTVPTTVAELSDSGSYALKTDIKTDTNQLTNGAGYITSTLTGTLYVKEICDENGTNCVTISDGLSSDTYIWDAGNYSACTATPYWTSYGSCTVSCGGGTKSRTCVTTTGTITRSVVCKKNGTTTVPDIFCAGLTKPSTSSTCTSSNLCSGSSTSSCNTQSCVPAIGDSYGGGKYVGGNLIAQTSDLGGTYTGLGAITACANSVVGGKIDWFLLNKTQLNSMYQNRSSIGGFSPYFYWSSNEVIGNYGSLWLQDFGNGYFSTAGNDYNTYSVRCIRTF